MVNAILIKRGSDAKGVGKIRMRRTKKKGEEECSGEDKGVGTVVTSPRRPDADLCPVKLVHRCSIYLICAGLTTSLSFSLLQYHLLFPAHSFLRSPSLLTHFQFLSVARAKHKTSLKIKTEYHSSNCEIYSMYNIYLIDLMIGNYQNKYYLY